MAISETVAYITVLGLTIIFTAFALVIQDHLWKVVLKFIAGMFWIIMAIVQFTYIGASGMLMILSLPYAIFGLVFWIAIYNDFLGDKKDRIWKFPDD